MGRVLGCRFGRIQFTADLMPSDITGAPIFDMKTQEFRFHPGPVFTQILLGDEINRSPAKTHAALLEIMQEYRVTVERTEPQAGSPVPGAGDSEPDRKRRDLQPARGAARSVHVQDHRRVPVGAAKKPRCCGCTASKSISISGSRDDLQTISSPEEIVATTQKCATVHVDDKLLNYINTLVRRTREWPQFHMGASPRAGISLMQGSRTLAAFSRPRLRRSRRRGRKSRCQRCGIE